jgi:hypothetical protein
MNSNLVRTILTSLGGFSALIPLLPGILGCVALATGSFDCTNSFVGPQFAVYLSIGLLIVTNLVKKFEGSTFFGSPADGFRTLTNWGAIAIMAASAIFGCVTDSVSGALSCSGTWLGPQWAGLIAAVLIGLNQVVKSLDGTTLTKPV